MCGRHVPEPTLLSTSFCVPEKGTPVWCSGSVSSRRQGGLGLMLVKARKLCWRIASSCNFSMSLHYKNISTIFTLTSSSPSLEGFGRTVGSTINPFHFFFCPSFQHIPFVLYIIVFVVPLVLSVSPLYHFQLFPSC